ncbi:hypothetical protein L596_004554 [Steinernema carpocapsae]|uniref:Uncharacterized protein n=1 Tax=Steinernema carpocapsae TaxID=34508 RepID=A0A4U8V0A1_STECR|nr:hypothetical protein L596_004554 [Steinernema carpocapsae]
MSEQNLSGCLMVSEPSFSKTEETEEIKHPADVPIKNGICATPPKENGVHPPKSETQEETLDGRDEDKSKRRKSVQFVFNERDQAAKKPLEDRPARTGKPAPSILHISPQRIDSLRTCDSELKEPTGAIFLPDHTVIVTDNQIGLILLSMSLDPICKSNDSQSQWKSAQSPVYVRDRGSVLVSLLYKEKDSVDYQRHLAEFDINFLAIKKRIVGPKWIIDYPNTRDRLSVAANGYVYLSVADAAFSGVYEFEWHLDRAPASLRPLLHRRASSRHRRSYHATPGGGGEAWVHLAPLRARVPRGRPEAARGGGATWRPRRRPARELLCLR